TTNLLGHRIKISHSSYQILLTLRSNHLFLLAKFDFIVQNDGDQVTLKTKIVTAEITGTLIDEDPLAIYTIDKVLLPRELFKVLAPPPSPAPTLESAAADAPASPKKEGKKKKQKVADAPADEESVPADSRSDAPDDSTNDGNGAVRFDGVRYGNIIFVLVFSSSATVYGWPKEVLCTEEFPLSAMNPYGRIKVISLQLLKKQEGVLEWALTYGFAGVFP
ncbi:hypothetical protein S245_022797, partial [Arachis hypogaea]